MGSLHFTNTCFVILSTSRIMVSNFMIISKNKKKFHKISKKRRTLSTRSGIDIKDVIEASHDFKSVSKLEKNRKMMEYMIGTIDQYVDDPRRQRLNRKMNFIRRYIVLMCFMFGKFLGNYLVVLYLFMKLLYIFNCIGQLFLISILLGRNYYIYGASIFRDMIQGKGYADSEYFPRVTMCKFQVRELGLKNTKFSKKKQASGQNLLVT